MLRHAEISSNKNYCTTLTNLRMGYQGSEFKISGSGSSGIHDENPRKVRLPSIASIAQLIPISNNLFNTSSSTPLPSVNDPQRSNNLRLSTSQEHQTLYVTETVAQVSPNTTPENQRFNRYQHAPPMMLPPSALYYHQTYPQPSTTPHYPPYPPPQQHFYNPSESNPLDSQSHADFQARYNPTHSPNIDGFKIKKRPERRLSKSHDRKTKKASSYCQRCGTFETPEWRKGPNGARTLCNACGLFHAKILKREGPEAAAYAITLMNNSRTRMIQRSALSSMSIHHEATMGHNNLLNSTNIQLQGQLHYQQPTAVPPSQPFVLLEQSALQNPTVSQQQHHDISNRVYSPSTAQIYYSPIGTPHLNEPHYSQYAPGPSDPNKVAQFHFRY